MAKKKLSLSGPAQLKELSKKAITAVAKVQVEYALDGGLNVLEMRAMASKMELFAGQVKDALNGQEAVKKEILSFGKGGTAIAGVKLEVVESGVSYNYENDPQWLEYNKLAEEAIAKRKAHEGLLKTLPHEGTMLLDVFTGEMYKAAPPLRSADESIKATIL